MENPVPSPPIGTTPSEPSRAAGPGSREEATTRGHLIRAALEIVATEGVAAVTTVEVCRRVGIAQSSYYSHFSSRDDLLRVMAEAGAADSRDANRRARDLLRENPEVERLRDTFRIPLDRIRRAPELFQLIQRARYEPAGSVLGDHGRAVAGLNRAELTDDLIAFARPQDDEVDAETRRRYAMVADCTNAMVEALAAGHLEGRYPDSEEIVDLLTIYASGSPALTEFLGWDPEPGQGEG